MSEATDRLKENLEEAKLPFIGDPPNTCVTVRIDDLETVLLELANSERAGRQAGREDAMGAVVRAGLEVMQPAPADPAEDAIHNAYTKGWNDGEQACRAAIRALQEPNDAKDERSTTEEGRQ